MGQEDRHERLAEPSPREVGLQVSRRDHPEVPSQGVVREDAARIGQILRDLCRQKDIELVEGKAMPDHIHMLLSVPGKYSIAMVIGYLKGKSATRIHRELLHTKGTLFGRSFWARGYCLSTVGLDKGGKSGVTSATRRSSNVIKTKVS